MAQLETVRSIPTVTPVPAELESESGRFRGVALELLLPGTQLAVKTRNSRYCLTVVDGREGRVTISGGILFEEQSAAKVTGAVDGTESRPGWVIEGFRLKVQTRVGPVLTSTVESIDVV